HIHRQGHAELAAIDDIRFAREQGFIGPATGRCECEHEGREQQNKAQTLHRHLPGGKKGAITRGATGVKVVSLSPRGLSSNRATERNTHAGGKKFGRLAVAGVPGAPACQLRSREPFSACIPVAAPPNWREPFSPCSRV